MTVAAGPLMRLIGNKGDGYYTRMSLAAVLDQQGYFKAAIQEYEKAAKLRDRFLNL